VSGALAGLRRDARKTRARVTNRVTGDDEAHFRCARPRTERPRGLARGAAVTLRAHRTGNSDGTALA
jgi:hypothetical protein